MTRSGLLGVLTLGVLFVGGCAKPEFKEFNSATGRYKVQMLGTPKEETKEAAGMTMNIASVQQRDGAFLVSWTDMPISGTESPAELETRLDGSRDGSLGNIQAKLTKETKIKLNGKYPGRDIEADLPGGKGSLHFKVFIVGKRLYQVMSVGSSSWAKSADTTKFLDSFVLVEK